MEIRISLFTKNNKIETMRTELTEKEYKYILTVLKVHKESYNDLLRGWGEKNDVDIFLENLIKKLETF